MTRIPFVNDESEAKERFFVLYRGKDGADKLLIYRGNVPMFFTEDDARKFMKFAISQVNSFQEFEFANRYIICQALFFDAIMEPPDQGTEEHF